MPCGWEGNRRSGVAVAMRHRLQWFIHLWAMVSQRTKFEVSRFTRYEAMNGMAVQNAENGAVRGHSKSWTMPPFERAHTTSYSTLIETMRLSCTVFEI